MLYNYYMKKSITWLSAAVCVISFCVSAVAQMTVVRVDGSKIYLDTSEEKTAPAVGSTFKVIVSSTPLTNPKTGKNLGDVYTYSSVGKITEVQPLYAVGECRNSSKILTT